MRCATRTTWRNETGNQAAEPLRICWPATLDELVALVREAEAADTTVRAVGSGHSWSDVTLTTGFLVETSELSRPLPLEADLLRPGADVSRLVRVEAGMRLRELNAQLADRELGLANMGGYDAQTVAGVMSTSTHGSGLALGPLADAVRSFDLVASGGEVHRIERADGPTDPDAYARRYRGARTLHADDHWFNAAVVAMGCMGIVYAVTLEVQPAFWLREVRTLSTWRQVRAQLEAGDVLREHRHVEIYLNPYRRGGDNRCLVTTRDPVPEPPPGHSDRRTRNLLPELAGALPFTGDALNLVADLAPRLTPRLLDAALAAVADEEYTDRSFRVLNIGTANLVPADSAEIGVPIDGRRRHLEAVERIVEIAARQRRLGRVYHTSPI